MNKTLKKKLDVLCLEHRRLHRECAKIALEEGLGVADEGEIRKRRKLVLRRHKRIHRSLALVLNLAGLGPDGRIWNKDFWKLDSDRPYSSYNDLYSSLRKQFKPLRREVWVTNLISDIVGAMDEIEEKRRGFGTPFWLYSLYTRYRDSNLLDFYNPATPSKYGLRDLPAKYRRSFLKDIGKGLFEMCALVAKDVLEEAEVEGVSGKLKRLNPPLTWAEVLYRYIYCDPSIGREKIEQLCPCTITRYCIRCDREFVVFKNNQGYFRCKKCSQTLRQRKYDEKARRCSETVGLSQPLTLIPKGLLGLPSREL